MKVVSPPLVGTRWSPVGKSESNAVVVLSSSPDQVGFRIERHGGVIEQDVYEGVRHNARKINRFVETRVVFETYYEQIDGLVNMVVTRGFGNERIASGHRGEWFEVRVGDTLVREWPLATDTFVKNQYADLCREIVAALTRNGADV